MPKKKISDPKEGDLIPVATISQSVIESYLFATGRQNLSIYSERLLLQLVKIAQKQVLGLNFKSGRDLHQVEIGSLGERLIEIDARSILGNETQTNYTVAKNAVLELMSKQISHERPKFNGDKPVYNADGSRMYEFEAHTLLNDVYINRKPGVIIVNVNKTTWETLLDFSKGFRRYDLQMAMSFSHSCTLRMYKLMSGQKAPLTYTIKELREQWNLTDKYKNNNDFIRFTIDAAKKELDESSPWTFEYETSVDETSGRNGRRSISKITFYPVHQPRFDSTSVVSSMVHPKDILGKPIIDALVKVGFDMGQIRANAVLLKTATKYFDLEAFIRKIAPAAMRARTSAQGYVINSVKRHLLEDYNVRVSKNQILTEAELLDSKPAGTEKSEPELAALVAHPEPKTAETAVPAEINRTAAGAPAARKPEARTPNSGGLFEPAQKRSGKNEPKSLGELIQGSLFSE